MPSAFPRVPQLNLLSSQGMLWNNPLRKAFWETTDDIDLNVHTELLVAFFRFLPQEDSLKLFSTCAEAERSEAVKTVAARACFTLVQEVSERLSLITVNLTPISAGPSLELAKTSRPADIFAGASFQRYICREFDYFVTCPPCLIPRIHSLLVPNAPKWISSAKSRELLRARGRKGSHTPHYRIVK